MSSIKFPPALAESPRRNSSAAGAGSSIGRTGRSGSTTHESLVHVVVVSSSSRDHTSLRNCLKGAAWAVRSAPDFRSAVEAIRDNVTQIVICSDDLQGGTWQDLLERVNSSTERSKFILATSDIDGRLWAEALQLGACDVIARPFNVEEVLHVVRTAWLSSSRFAHAARAAS